MFHEVKVLVLQRLQVDLCVKELWLLVEQSIDENIKE